MKRLIAMLMLCTLTFAAVPGLAAEQLSVPARNLNAYADGLFLVESDYGQYCVYDEDGKLVLESTGDGISISVSFVMGSDGKSVRTLFADDKCAKICKTDATTYQSKYGLISKKGKIISECVYDMIGTFSDGIATVKQGEKYGYISTGGKIISECQWDSAKDLSGGMAVVKKGEKYCILNKKGEVIGKNYLRVQDQVDGYMAVQTSKGWGVINKKGKQVIKCQYSNIRLCGNGIVAVQDQSKNNTSYYAYMNLKGKLLTKYIYTWPSYSYSDDLMIVEYAGGDQRAHVGIMNKKGKLAIPLGLTASYTGGYQAGGFKNGICYLEQATGKYDPKKSTWGFIDKKGKWAIELKSRTYEPYENGNVWLSSKLIKIRALGSGMAKYGIMDTKGKVISKCVWDDIDPFVDGLAKVTKRQEARQPGSYDTVVGYINTKGETVIPCEWKNTWSTDSQKNGLIILGKARADSYGSLFGCFNKKGKAILPVEYDQVVIGDRVIAATKGNQMLFFDLKGKPIMQEETVEEAAPVEENTPENTESPTDMGEAA